MCDDAFTERVLLRCELVGVGNRHSAIREAPVRCFSGPARPCFIGESRLSGGATKPEVFYGQRRAVGLTGFVHAVGADVPLAFEPAGFCPPRM